MKGYLEGYKVVRRNITGEWVSACMNWSLMPPYAEVTYKVGKPTVPHPGCGPLCVFKWRESAVDFVRHMETDSSRTFGVFRVLYKPSTEATVWTIQKRDAEEFFSETGLAELSGRYGPTRLADEVILEEECL